MSEIKIDVKVWESDLHSLLFLLNHGLTGEAIEALDLEALRDDIQAILGDNVADKLATDFAENGIEFHSSADIIL